MLDVKIRPLQIEDARTSWKWRNDSDVWVYTGSRPDRTISYNDELEWIKKVTKEKSSVRFAILVNEKYVGNTQITNIDSGKGQVHIFIGDKNFWGKGVASKALGLLSRYAKEVLKLHEIYAQVNPLNEASLKAFLINSFIQKNNEIILIKQLHG